MKGNNKRLDKTSLIMILIFAVLVIGSVAAVFASTIAAEKEREKQNEIQDITELVDGADNDAGEMTVEDILKAVPNAAPGSTYSYFDDDGVMRTVTIPLDYKAEENNTAVVDNSGKYKFTEYTDLTDKFMEICSTGDIDDLYNIYYADFLDEMRMNMKDAPSKAEFDAGLKANMRSITGFDEYEYGTVEMPPTQSAGSYANYIYSQVNAGKTIPLTENDIEDAVNLTVYIDNMYQTQHFMAKINGYWYFIV